MATFDDEYGLLNDGWGGGGYFGPALSVGADQSYVTPRTDASTPTNAVDSMQPVVSASQDDGFGWLKDLAKTAVGYVISKDAQQNKVVPPAAYNATAAQAQGQRAQQAQNNSGLLLVGLMIVGAVVLLKD